VALTPGQNARFTFAGTAGQTATITPTAGGTISLAKAEILSTNGTTSLGNNYWDTSGGTAVSGVLPATGTYTFVIDPVGDAGGSISFGLALT
jgi:hypothetical protein